ncbi:MAG: protocatechuate 3,4-dioxygenase subunit alpha [Gammaproteobacteria bacterium]|nr:protocatechuate 3,4-dioxygenase subunit alpha [Gammaproteobacteria bacterium]MDH3448747.1 protocatechuate 3,4-dioxygenase subunit alpha [Gammaproteobacteria bacterium]
MAHVEKPLHESPSQTAGPYVHIGCTPNFAGIEGVYAEDPGSRMVNEHTLGERITLRGTVYDGEGSPLKDAVLEIWQADAAGLYPSPQDTRGAADPNFGGWGRCAADLESGEFAFATIRPGRVPYPDGRLQAPHVTVWIVARGINVGLHTRLYFADLPEANSEDPILMRVEPRDRVDTLLAKRERDGVFRFDIHLQGERETVFLDM